MNTELDQLIGMGLHQNSLKNMIDDSITFEDSTGHKIIALNDGTYITIEDEVATLLGEASISNSRWKKIKMTCQNRMSIVLNG